MRFKSRSFKIAKDAENPEQYEDAFAFDDEQGVASVADGVGASIFAGEWARLLTKATVAQPPNLEDFDRFQAWLTELRAVWREPIDIGQLKWFQRPKMVDGAACTLLWMSLSPLNGEAAEPGAYRIQMTAIGDSCLFHLRQDEVLRFFPVECSDDFDLIPGAIGSVDRKQDHRMEFKTVDDDCLAGDLLVLCTDAIAEWAIARWEAGAPVDWDVYWDMPQAVWEEEIAALRREKQMRYDDTTLLLLRVIEETPAEEAASGEEDPGEETAVEMPTQDASPTPEEDSPDDGESASLEEEIDAEEVTAEKRASEEQTLEEETAGEGIGEEQMAEEETAEKETSEEEEPPLDETRQAAAEPAEENSGSDPEDDVSRRRIDE